MRAKILLISGKEAKFVIPKPDHLPSWYFFSMDRSGSSLFWEMAKDLLQIARRPYCEVLEDLFEQGIHREEVDTASFRDVIRRSGYAFGMFRSFDPALQDFDLSENKKFLLIRDPRDVIVSLYFSMAGSHRVPETGALKDALMQTRQVLTDLPFREYAQSEMINIIHRKYEGYVRFCREQKPVEIFRYEDVIFNKFGWISTLAERLDVNVTPRKLAEMAYEYDNIPASERPLKNIRQVRPGNWRHHLDKETTAFIENKFAREMAFFGYVPEVAEPSVLRDMLPEFCAALAQRFINTEELLFDTALQRRHLAQTLRAKQKRERSARNKQATVRGEASQQPLSAKPAGNRSGRRRRATLRAAATSQS